MEWNIELYALDPAQFTEGRISVARLSPQDNPRRLPGGPLEIGVAQAKLGSKNLNLPGLIADKVASVLFSPLDEFLGQGQFRIQSTTPGVYV
ncbi:MAG: hypothetical protein EXS36_17520 [Pedosphaera sp.]|nr:hypothetical protein [Pedosphaera sp.]